jgi:hypothetical protein
VLLLELRAVAVVMTPQPVRSSFVPVALPWLWQLRFVMLVLREPRRAKFLQKPAQGICERRFHNIEINI